MKAVVRDEYGAPEVLRVEELPEPVPRDDEVVVDVRAASVAKGDWEILNGSPAWVRVSGFGLRRPKHRVLGYNFAGVVTAAGSAVKRLRVGDEVFGDTLMDGLGAFAERMRVPENAAIAAKPAGVSFEDAASVPEAGFIALQGLRKAGVEAGQRLLLNGAGGGAGSFAIQLAKSYGVDVTAVDRGEKLDHMRALGADSVIDCEDSDLGNGYDAILDVVGVRSLGTWKRMLKPAGVYLAAGGSVGYILKTLLLGGSRIKMLAAKPNVDDLGEIARLLADGTVRATIDRRYTLDEVPEALRHIGAGRSRGKLVIVPSLSAKEH